MAPDSIMMLSGIFLSRYYLFGSFFIRIHLNDHTHSGSKNQTLF